MQNYLTDSWRARKSDGRSKAPELPESYYMNRFFNGLLQETGNQTEGDGQILAWGLIQTLIMAFAALD